MSSHSCVQNTEAYNAHKQQILNNIAHLLPFNLRQVLCVEYPGCFQRFSDMSSEQQAPPGQI